MNAPLLTRMHGHNARRYADPKLRYAGRYSLSFGGTTTANATINSGDQQYGGSPLRQLLLVVGAEVPTVTAVSVGGQPCACIIRELGGFVTIWGIQTAEAGNLAVVVTLAATSTEVGAFDVFEVDNGEHLTKCPRSPNGTSAVGTTQTMALALQQGAVAVGAVLSTTDTATFTWTGLSEVTDADAGDYRLSSAAQTANQAASARTTVTAVSTSGNARIAGVTIPPVGKPRVKGGMTSLTSLNPSGGTSVTITTDGAANGYGPHKVVVGFATAVNVAITGVTYGGVAMNLAGSAVDTSATPDARVHFYELDIVPDSTPRSIVVTYASAATATILVAVWRISDCNSVGAAGTTIGSGATASTTVDTQEGGMVLAYGVNYMSSAATFVGVDKLYDQTGGFYIGELHDAPTQTGRTVSATFTAGNYAMVVLPLNP